MISNLTRIPLILQHEQRTFLCSDYFVCIEKINVSMADSDDLTTNMKRKKLTYSNGGVPDLQEQDSEIHDGPSVEQRRNRKLCPHCKQELSVLKNIQISQAPLF